MSEWLVGVVAGLLSGLLITLYFRYLDKLKNIVDYAEKTWAIANKIYMETIEYLTTTDSSRLRVLFQDYLSIRRHFQGHYDKKLNKAVRNCNECLTDIKHELEKKNRSQLLQAKGHLSSKLVDLDKEIIEFERRMYRIQNYGTIALLLGLVVLVLCYNYICMF